MTTLQDYPEAANEPDLSSPDVLALYLQCRANGTGHELSMTLALRRAPGVQTSDTFWAGRQRFDQVYGEHYANTIKQNFAKRGINLKNGDEYCPELCRPEYSVANPDPEAIVPFSDARGHIKKVCEQRGWEVNGAVTVKHREPLKDPHAPENCIPLAADLVDAQAIQMCRQNPDLQRKTKGELREMVIEKHGPSTRT